MKARHCFYVVVTVLCASISIVGFYHDGSIPVLELVLGFSPSHPQLHANTPPRQVAGYFPPLHLLNRSQSLPRCKCPLPSDDEGRNESSSSLAFVSSRVEKVIPLKQLQKKISFSRYRGLSYLDHTALNRYYLCPTRLSVVEVFDSNVSQCKERTFLDRESPIVALVSFPGSGNTWLRYLLEQATGVYTGSLYCDHSLKAVFPGEYVVSGSVLVVKTHHGDTRELPEDVQAVSGRKFFDRAVVVVRDPYDALVSEANRRWNSKKAVDSHIGIADETSFISNSRWDWYVEYRSVGWGLLLHTWLAHKRLPVHVVQYERLQSDLRRELTAVLEFLGFPPDNMTMDCVMENSGGHFKRKRHLNFNPYTSENKAAVNRVLAQASPLLAQYGIKYNTR